MSNPASVSVIIVNYNGRHYLEQCLSALKTTRFDSLEIIVVDNGSTDQSVAWMMHNHPDVRTVDLRQNIGFGQGNLRGVEASCGEYVVLLNSDTVVQPEWLEPLIAPLRYDNRIGATCSVLRLLDMPEVVNAHGGGMSRLGFGYDHQFMFSAIRDEGVESPDQEAVADVFFPTGAAMAMRRHDFLRFRFDPKMFMYHEDVDMGWRLRLAGKRVVVCRDSVVLHKFCGTSASHKGAYWRAMMGMRHNVRSILKNYEPHNVLQSLRQLVLLMHRQRSYKIMLKTVGWNLLHLGDTLRERRRIQSTRTISDVDLFVAGLITDTKCPPVPPDEPPNVSRNPPECLLSNPLLEPGLHSAAGRLGPGWYYTQELDGVAFRRTAGNAKCTLRVAPGAVGYLSICLQTPECCRESAAVSIHCNGKTVIHMPKGNAWETLRMPVTADSGGMLRIEFESETRKEVHQDDPDHVRYVGCAVQWLWFVPDAPGPGDQELTATVIVTTCNRWPILCECLEALARQDVRDFNAIIVDDGSTDGTWKQVQKWKTANAARLDLSLLRQENAGQGMARNAALNLQECGDIIIFIGDDILTETDFVRSHLDRHRSTRCPTAFVGHTEWDETRMHVTPSLKHVSNEGQQFGYRFMQDGKEAPFTCFYTSNLSVPREILGKDPFDSLFKTYGWEDVELGYRLSMRGMRIVYAATARARHVHPMTLHDLYERQRKVGNAVHTLYALHPQIQTNPAMPRLHHARFFRRFEPFARLFLPVLNYIDKRGIRIPGYLINKFLEIGFSSGLMENLYG